MAKYRVSVRGGNLLAEIKGVRQRIGFYTTVFIEAFSSRDAEQGALELLSCDGKLEKLILNSDDDPITLLLEETHEIDDSDAVTPSRTGFAFFQESVK